jgi:hypothetical protein
LDGWVRQSIDVPRHARRHPATTLLDVLLGLRRDDADLERQRALVPSLPRLTAHTYCSLPIICRVSLSISGGLWRDAAVLDEP